MSLVEVMVSMAVMSVAMGIFTTAVLQIHRTLRSTESMSTAQSLAATAFERLDRELRYASQINTPTTAGGDYYVEYLMTNSSTPTCVQLRLLAVQKQLQRRQWPQGGVPAATWIPMVSPVVPAHPLSATTAPAPVSGSVQPFVVLAADTVYPYQKLQVNVQIDGAAAGGGTTTARQLSVTFPALNSSTEPTTTFVCSEGRAS